LRLFAIEILRFGIWRLLIEGVPAERRSAFIPHVNVVVIGIEQNRRAPADEVDELTLLWLMFPTSAQPLCDDPAGSRKSPVVSRR
jgi:hypothetical protein